jgi:hypothetical protein
MNRVCLALVLAAALAPQAQAKVVYVNQNAPGNTHDGMSWATAFLTVAEGLAAAVANDEIWIAKGLYYERVTVPGGLALYGGFAGTETERNLRDPAVNGSILDAADMGSVIICTGPDTVIDGLTLRKSYPAGSGVGVSAGGSVTVSGNVFSSNLNGVHVAPGATAVVRGNQFLVNPNGVYVLGNSATDYGSATVVGNTFYGGVGVNVRKFGAAAASENVFYDMMNAAIVFGTATLTGNTIAGSASDAIYVFKGGLQLTNNIISFSELYGVLVLGAESRVAFEHNLFHGNTKGTTSGVPEPVGTYGNISGDPMFVDFAGNDFHLKAGSPCIDAGDDTAASGQTDRDGKPRIQGAHVDIGAYEYGTGPAPFTMADVGKALGLCSGLLSCTEGDLARFDVQPGSAGLDLRDAICLARKVAGLDSNP